MKSKDLRERSVEDLKELEKSLQRDTFTNRFKNAMNKARKDLARVKTILRERELVAATKSETKA